MTESIDPIAANTVIHLAAHMVQLREEATRLQASFGTRNRGYFTPSEDDQVAHLWVSYHKARAALLEVIDSIRSSVRKASPEKSDVFLVAFAAALVLVDAARTLRELFSDNSLVRDKLNEKFDSYGIAAGSFDAIQMSLTDPTNAYRLRQATDFFDRHEDLIRREASSDGLLRLVLQVVDGLIPRVRLSSVHYLKARAVDRRRDVSSWVGDGIWHAMYLIQEMGSRAASNIKTLPRHVPRVPQPIRLQLLPMLQPGDVLVTRKENALTNYFLPGYWPHAAFYAGNERVIEALKDGVHERTMDSPLGNDAIAVIRPKLSAGQIETAIARARKHVGKPYDFDFDFTRADRLVCTEVVYRSLEGLEGIDLPLATRVGRKNLSAEDLLRLAIRDIQFIQVAVYCPKFSADLLVTPEMTRILEQTVAEDTPN